MVKHACIALTFLTSLLFCADMNHQVSEHDDSLRACMNLCKQEMPLDRVNEFTTCSVNIKSTAFYNPRGRIQYEIDKRGFQTNLSLKLALSDDDPLSASDEMNDTIEVSGSEYRDNSGQIAQRVAQFFHGTSVLVAIKKEYGSA